ncbi:SDR family NAD(P)-dependent oxidoreductase [Pedobacter sp. SAFR-022]|uniref:SDR family NAD(P)-dependent oxidoreductase n=1 Tax=Pedobacter sp. SAFR-022 TaxID=3436861 RepID=UPI003F7DAB21
MSFENKVAIVSGAGQGIGLEICRKLCAAGARVILNDVDAELAAQAVLELNNAGGVCIAVPGDSSDLSIIQQIVDTAVSNFGKLDIAIANAGITLFGDFFSYSPEAFSRVMQVNLNGTFFLAQAAAKQMKAQTSGGRLLFMSSVTGHQAHRNLAAYGMSKAALEMLARNLVIEVSRFGITVNCIAPGATATERTLEDPDYEKTWARITPTGRAGTVQDVASTAMFLVSDEASQITGQTILVDGGWSAVSPDPY